MTCAPRPAVGTGRNCQISCRAGFHWYEFCDLRRLARTCSSVTDLVTGQCDTDPPAVGYVKKRKVKFTLEQAVKAQTWSRGTALLFL